MRVLIIGAGPTGLTLALALRHRGIAYRLIECRTGPESWSRALGLQARTNPAVRRARELLDAGAVGRVYTNLAVLEVVPGRGFAVIDLAPGVTPEALAEHTGATLLEREAA